MTHTVTSKPTAIKAIAKLPIPLSFFMADWFSGSTIEALFVVVMFVLLGVRVVAGRGSVLVTIAADVPGVWVEGLRLDLDTIVVGVGATVEGLDVDDGDFVVTRFLVGVGNRAVVVRRCVVTVARSVVVYIRVIIEEETLVGGTVELDDELVLDVRRVGDMVEVPERIGEKHNRLEQNKKYTAKL